MTISLCPCLIAIYRAGKEGSPSTAEKLGLAGCSLGGTAPVGWAEKGSCRETGNQGRQALRGRRAARRLEGSGIKAVSGGRPYNKPFAADGPREVFVEGVFD